jgi:hemerythrin superfamily protein
MASGQTTKGRKGEGTRKAQMAEIDALQLLEQQHRAVDQAFERLRSSADDREARQLFVELGRLLVGHAAIEEKHFYPAVRTVETEALVSGSLHDHQEVKKLLLHMLDADLPDEDFGELLEDLQGMVEGHVREEEDDLFPKARTLLAAEELQAMAQEMIATFAEEQEAGEPRERLAEELEAAGLAPSI